MDSLLSQYLFENYRMIPAGVYIWLGLVFCFGTVLFWAFLGFRKGTKWAAGLLLLEYLLLLYSLTVIFRETQGTRMHFLTPFWSYRTILAGSDLLLIQDVMNVIVFIPVGVLLSYAFGRIKWWQVLSTGVMISFGIEFLQFVLKRGFAEFDDVLHNSLGCLVGYGLFIGFSYLIKGGAERKRMACKC